VTLAIASAAKEVALRKKVMDQCAAILGNLRSKRKGVAPFVANCSETQMNPDKQQKVDANCANLREWTESCFSFATIRAIRVHLGFIPG